MNQLILCNFILKKQILNISMSFEVKLFSLLIKILFLFCDSKFQYWFLFKIDLIKMLITFRGVLSNDIRHNIQHNFFLSSQQQQKMMNNRFLLKSHPRVDGKCSFKIYLCQKKNFALFSNVNLLCFMQKKQLYENG